MRQKNKPFSKERLLSSLQQLPSAKVYWVGFSGGADSTALLFAIHELKPEMKAGIKALHINHGLHEDADKWQAHCQRICRRLGIELQTCSVRVGRNSGSGLEAEARRLRYEIVENILNENELFLTAHHRDDQAETLLLNLVRGSGVDGLAGMPETRALGAGLLARPLLDFSMHSLRLYLQERNLEWLEDPSNQDQSYDRNFVRQHLIPELENRWPGVSGRLSTSAGHCRDASIALAKWADTALSGRRPHERVLELPGLDYHGSEFRFLIRHWLNVNQAPSLPLRQLQELSRQCSHASPGSRVRIGWEGWVIHLFRDCLWLQPETSISTCPELKWDNSTAINLGPEIGVLEFKPSVEHWPAGISVNSRVEGERIQVHPGGQHRSIKDLYREAGIPPWLRPSIPLLHRDGATLAAGDMVISPELNEWLNRSQSSFRWQPADPLLKFVHSQCRREAVDRAEALG